MEGITWLLTTFLYGAATSPQVSIGACFLKCSIAKAKYVKMNNEVQCKKNIVSVIGIKMCQQEGRSEE